MKQYCRYCCYFVTGNGNWCEAKMKTVTDSTAKSVNHCKDFEFNPMDAFWENLSGYHPRKPKKDDGEQMMFDLGEVARE